MADIVVRNADDLLQRTDLAHSAVITIDIQNDFCHDRGSYRRAGFDVTSFQEMAPRVETFLEKVRKIKVPVIHVAQIYTSWTMSAPFLQRLKLYHVDPDKTLQPGSWGAQFYGIKPLDDECVVTKYRDSAFFGTDLDQILRCAMVNTIVLTGCATGGCVECTARDGFFRDYFVVTLEDCTAGGIKKVHESALIRLASIGAVTSSGVLLEAWDRISRIAGYGAIDVSKK